MNDSRRKRVRKVAQVLGRELVLLGELASEEHEAYEGMPENMRCGGSRKVDRTAYLIQSLDTLYGDLKKVVSALYTLEEGWVYREWDVKTPPCERSLGHPSQEG